MNKATDYNSNVLFT